jgi:hypothetical protein
MSERDKKQCIVLFPSGPHFDRLFTEIIAPAIADSGLTPIHLPANSRSPIPINIFVDEIEQAEALLADVSENTAEIWLAVGCAVALGKPLCLVSSTLDSTLPLGIQYLPLVPYPTRPFPGDYLQLQQDISNQLSAIVPMQQPAQPEPQLQVPFLPSTPLAAPSGELASYEIMALTIIDLKGSDLGLSPRDLGLEMQARNSAHLTSHAMNALKRRQFIERKPVQISQGNELHISENLFITRVGQDWLSRHGKRATTHRSTVRGRDLSLNIK